MTPEEKVDELLTVRAMMRVLKPQEEALTEELKAHMKSQGLAVLAGEKGIARLTSKTMKDIDAQRLVEALGWSLVKRAIRASIEECRKFMGEEAIDIFATKRQESVLYVDPKPEQSDGDSKR